MPDSVSLLIGTTKGAFILSSCAAREDWSLSGPHCDGWPINHMAGDPDSGTIAAGGGSEWTGAGVWLSNDGGNSWRLSKLSKGTIDEWAANDPDMAAMFDWTDQPVPFEELKAVWSVTYAHGALLAGTNPAMLVRSTDHGQSWDQVEGLSNHPSRDSWNPGAAGLVLHTIITDPACPDKLWVGISAAGVFATEDGGASWEPRNRMSNTESCRQHDHPAAPRDGEIGYCVHNMVRADATPGDLLYQQNHHGVYRSPDGGRNWDDITEGLPSTFGFPIAIHPGDPNTIWTVPLNGDMAGRYPPDAAAAVWKSNDGGSSWQACRNGLPQRGCFFTVLRQAMTTDRQEAPGVYFGTNSGSVFASTDGGDTWRELAQHLPTVLSVEAFEQPG